MSEAKDVASYDLYYFKALKFVSLGNVLNIPKPSKRSAEELRKIFYGFRAALQADPSMDDTLAMDSKGMKFYVKEVSDGTGILQIRHKDPHAESIARALEHTQADTQQETHDEQQINIDFGEGTPR